MARYQCPGCGMPYDGKKCRNCYYETFTEEIAHGDHTHRGEPLVIKSASRRPVPRKDPFGCEKKTRKKGKRLPATLLAVLLFFAEPVAELAADLIESMEDTVSAFTTQAEPEPEAKLPEDTMILYQDENVCIRTDWQYDSFEDGLSIILENNSDRDITVSTRDVIVNGYLMEYASLYCRAGGGQTGWGQLDLDETDLRKAGIGDIQKISLDLEICDSDTYEILALTPAFDLATDPDYVPTANDLGGMTVLEQDGLRVSYLGYAPSDYAPEEFREGTLLFHIENTTEHALLVYTSEAVPDVTIWCEVPPQTNVVTDAYLYSLEEQGINSLEDMPQLNFCLEVWDWEDGTEFRSDPITVSTSS